MAGTIAGNTPGQYFTAVGNITPQLIRTFIVDLCNLIYAEAAYPFALSASLLAHMNASNLKWNIIIRTGISAVLLKTGIDSAGTGVTSAVQKADAVGDYFGYVPPLPVLFIAPHLHPSIHSHKAALAQVVCAVLRLLPPNDYRNKVCFPFPVFIEKGAVDGKGKGCHGRPGRNVL